MTSSNSSPAALVLLSWVLGIFILYFCSLSCVMYVTCHVSHVTCVMYVMVMILLFENDARYLYPRFCIHVSRSDEMDIVDQYLPSASTCMNLLKLPQYSNKKALREKLLYLFSLLPLSCPSPSLLSPILPCLTLPPLPFSLFHCAVHLRLFKICYFQWGWV